MEFVAVVLGVMAVSVLLIHWLTNRLGCRMKYRSLLLCGLMAFAVNMAAIRFSPYLTQEHYMRLGFMVLAASAIVTFYNERLVRREERLAAAAEGVIVPSSEKGDAPEEAARVNPAEGMPGEKAETEADPSPLPAGDAQPEEPTEPKDAGTEAVSEGEDPSPGDMPRESGAVKPADPLASLASMDDFLDYAFEQSAKGNDPGAIAAYRAALERYAKDEYAPFIAIDLGNIYKNRADYDAAIQVYEEALDLPFVAQSDGTYQEFVKNLSYLHIVRGVLARRNALDVPFAQIGPDCMSEIEDEFQSQQAHPLH